MYAYSCVRKRVSGDAATIASPHDATPGPLGAANAATRRSCGAATTTRTGTRSVAFVLLDDVVKTHLYLVHFHLCCRLFQLLLHNKYTRLHNLTSSSSTDAPAMAAVYIEISNFTGRPISARARPLRGGSTVARATFALFLTLSHQQGQAYSPTVDDEIMEKLNK